jgi:hypothetical protein
MVAGTNYRCGRLPRGLLVGVVPVSLVAVSLLAGCGGNGGSSGQAAAGSSSPSSAASSSASGPKESSLAKGLLSPSAFGSQAEVVTLTLQQFQQATSGKLGQAPGLTVDPPQCAAALKSTQPETDKVKDLVAEAATTRSGTQGTVTVEAIATGDLVDGAIGQMTTTVQNCPKVTVTSPQFGRATVEFSRIDVSKIADRAAAVQFTTTITPPGQPSVTVPALIGAVRDGDRLVMLVDAVAGNPGGAASPSGGTAQPSVAPPDTAAFTSLLQKAYTTEKDALG